jgi:hypothetical protein
MLFVVLKMAIQKEEKNFVCVCEEPSDLQVRKAHMSGSLGY